MADLPYDRTVLGMPPFTNVGVDCFGPFKVKRGRVEVKRYGCVFTCLVVRAIHIEVLHSLETDSFINALGRFISRRGTPRLIRSDNATNFVGANNALKAALGEWNQSKIGETLCRQGVEWVFNTPAASHHGGVWERMVRTVRKVIASVANEQVLDDKSLCTLMCHVESIINGRPITTVLDDPKDLEPLTPNHLLLLGAGMSLNLGTFTVTDIYRKRWRQVQYLTDVFWRRYLREYLPQLQKRQKWDKAAANLKSGDVVLVVDYSVPRNQWCLGRIVDVFPGSDGLIRSVQVRTKSALLSRPIQKICLLERV